MYAFTTMNNNFSSFMAGVITGSFLSSPPEFRNWTSVAVQTVNILPSLSSTMLDTANATPLEFSTELDVLNAVPLEFLTEQMYAISQPLEAT